MEEVIGILGLLIAFLTFIYTFFRKPTEELEHLKNQFKMTQKLSLEIQEQMQILISTTDAYHQITFQGIPFKKYLKTLKEAYPSTLSDELYNKVTALKLSKSMILSMTNSLETQFNDLLQVQTYLKTIDNTPQTKSMKQIQLQKKTSPFSGRIEKYVFENKTTGLARTLFHRIYIPLAPFDSGLDWAEQPEETEIVIEWIKLGLVNPDSLDGLKINSKNYPLLEASIYVGTSHNACDVIELNINSIEGNLYKVDGIINVDFESEGVGENESFKFQTEIEYHI